MVKKLRIFFTEEFNGSAPEQMKRAAEMIDDWLRLGRAAGRFGCRPQAMHHVEGLKDMSQERLHDVAEAQAELEQGAPLKKTGRKGEQEQTIEMTQEMHPKLLTSSWYVEALQRDRSQVLKETRAASAAEPEKSHTDQASSDTDDFFTESCNMELRWQVEVKTPHKRTRRSKRAVQRFRHWELNRERAMMEEEDKKSEAEERSTRFWSDPEEYLNNMLEQLGFAGWRVVPR